MKVTRIQKGCGYMEALYLATKKGWEYAWIGSAYADGKTFAGIGKISGSVDDFESDGTEYEENGDMEIVEDYGDKIMVKSNEKWITLIRRNGDGHEKA